jgi:hypothetical protein
MSPRPLLLIVDPNTYHVLTAALNGFWLERGGRYLPKGSSRPWTSRAGIG